MYLLADRYLAEGVSASAASATSRGKVDTSPHQSGGSGTPWSRKTEPTFADNAQSPPGWRDAAVDYHKDRGLRVSVTSYTADELARLRELMADNVTLERAWHETHPADRAAASTVEALMLALGERDTKALAEPKVQVAFLSLARSKSRRLPLACGSSNRTSPKSGPPMRPSS